MESVQHYINEGILYEPVIPEIRNWPIARLSQDRRNYLAAVMADAQQALRAKHPDNDQMAALIERTMFQERIRMTEDPWKVDPTDERKFWSRVKKDLVRLEQEKEQKGLGEPYIHLLDGIIDRFTHEIAGNFRPSSYHFAKRFLPFFFSTLLNASAGKTIKSTVQHSVGLQEKVHLLGETEAIRRLTKIGTVVLVPTHFSNVDSILIGWGLHALGLPAFIYGAGLNLYNTKVLAYFMNRLGAYKVDRRKKNPIYREVLNAYSTEALTRGVHSLFFPGGTRSRSGAIENHLKLGLLGTAIEAQRRNFLGPNPQKIFVVPLVMSYHFVLEASSLINQHLKSTGQSQYYLANDEASNYWTFLKFVWKTFSASSEIALSFGKPMDLFGNFVDEAGNSLDPQGRNIDISAYFRSRGEFRADAQRDAEYTRRLGDLIVDRYQIENRVFSSHLVAFVAFEWLKKNHSDFDLYGLLRLPEEERHIPVSAMLTSVERVLNALQRLESQGKVHLASHLVNDVPTILEHGVKNLGIYHPRRPLSFQDEQTLGTDSMNLLYYYHNRLEGYGLAKYV
jgi:glycerol-3-phosphate O-acyltransferase